MFDTLFDAPPAVGPPVQPLVTASAAEAADPGVLAAAQQARCTVYRGEVALLRAAALFADEHPVAEGSCGDGYAGTWHRVDGEERVMPLAGQGAPLVAEFAPAELGAVLGTSTEQARRLVGEALELRHRLPRI